MQNIDIIHEKIDNLLKIHHDLKKENECLRNQLVAAQAQNETLNGKIRTLEETLSQKDTRLDALAQKLDGFGS